MSGQGEEGKVADDNLEERIRDAIIGEIESPTVVVADYDPP